MSDKGNLDRTMVKRITKGADNVCGAIHKVRKALDEMSRNKKLSPAEMVDVFALVRDCNDRMETARKEIGAVRDRLSMEVLPGMFEEEGIKTLTTETGLRATVSVRFSASILDKEKAFKWLRKNELGDIIVETVNAQTLGKTLSEIIETDNVEPPEDIFKLSYNPNMSLTRVK